MHSLYMSATSSTLDNYTNNDYLEPLPGQDIFVSAFADILFAYARTYFERTTPGRQFSPNVIRKHISDVPGLLLNLKRFLSA